MTRPLATPVYPEIKGSRERLGDLPIAKPNAVPRRARPGRWDSRTGSCLLTQAATTET
jgi:hypothetical protein